jgi:hypothetical protein
MPDLILFGNINLDLLFVSAGDALELSPSVSSINKGIIRSRQLLDRPLRGVDMSFRLAGCRHGYSVRRGLLKVEISWIGQEKPFPFNLDTVTA